MRFILSVLAWGLLIAQCPAFPTHTSTGTFNVATAGNAAWNAFTWEWSNQDVQQMTPVFTSAAADLSGITNVQFRLSYPEAGPSYLTIYNCSLIVGDSSVSYTLPTPLPTTNIPTPRTYYAEFMGLSTNLTRSLAKGRVKITWSLFSTTNTASWTPIIVSYTTTGVVTFTETDPIYSASVASRITAADTNKWHTFATSTATLNTAVAALQVNTGTLNTAVAALQVNTGTLNTAVAALQVNTGALHTAVAGLLVDTGTLNTAVTALQVNTGALNTAVADLQTSTSTLNTAVADLNSSTQSLDSFVTVMWTNYANLASTQALNTEVSVLWTNYANIASTQSLNTAVVALNASTNSLQTKVTALNASTGSLNTAVASLQTSTGTINTAVAALQASTGALNTAVTALNASTGSLNTAVTALNTSTGTLNTAVTGLQTSTGMLNTAVAGLQTSTGTLNMAVGVLQTSTNALQTQVTALKAATNSIDIRVATLEGAGNLTSTTNIFTELYAANRSVLGANLSGLTQGVYTGSLTSVAYTGVTELALGKTYAWGFTKIGSDGTATVSIASQSLSSTAAGLVTNHFTYTAADTNLILTLAGNGLAICNVSNLYVKQITNGNINVAGDVNIGGVMRVDGAVMLNPSVHIASTGTNVHGLGTASTNNTGDFYPAGNPNGYASTGTVVTIDAMNSESNRAVSVEQQLGAAVTNLNTATNSLNTRADALETSTGTLNTAVANLQTSTGSLNSAVSDLNAATGSLNSAVANILTATGALNSAVGDLQISTGTLNSAVGNLNTATGSLNTAVGTLNTATNSLNTRVTDLEGGGSAAGWSGFAATQQVFWSYATPIVATNISVTGSGLNPDVSGVYTYGGLNEGQSYWSSTNGYYIFVINLEHPAYMICNNMYSVPNEYFYRGDGAGPVGSYDPNTPYVAGTPVAVYSYVTNTYEWKAGPDPDDGQAWKLTLGGTNIYRAYAASNVFNKPIYGDGSGLTNLIVPELTNSYQPYTASLTPDAGGTCLVAYSHGSLVKIENPATNITLSFDTASYTQTSGVVRVGIMIYSLTNSVSLDFATCTNENTATKSTTGWTRWLFWRVGNEIFKGRQ